MWEELKYESTVFYYKAIEFDFLTMSYVFNKNQS